uniref:VIT domain-containing protein n=1 Tax=Paramormyrops kingsleyae TaxID=1676925 RepID=A0A3B3S7X4_9TELE
MANVCGLRTLKNEPVPLKSVEVQVDVQGHVASVSSTLQYENQESSPVEAVFIFPMESNATIYSFVARIGDVEIKAQVKEKAQAQEEYDDAVSSGQQAFLLEESDESSDVFRLSVGSLPPGQSASVTLSYVTELAVQADDALSESVEYTQANMETAEQKVKSMQADMGGTEILQVLQDVYSKPCLPSRPRQLFVFTDGEVGNTKDVIDLVKRHALSHRCFTFGIGEGASSALVNGMAEGGSGHPQFITGAERLQPKVMQSLQFALQPVVEDISVKWNIPADISVTPLSPLPNVIFQNQRAILYFQLAGQLALSSQSSHHPNICHHDVVRILVPMPTFPTLSRSHCLHVERHTLSLSCFFSPFHISPFLHTLPMLTPHFPYGKIGRVVKNDDHDICKALINCQLKIDPPERQKVGDPLLELISLQKVDGSWDLQPSLASIFGKKEEEVATPEFLSVWATVLAVLWLHGHKMDFKDEWQFVAAKAVAWIRAQSGRRDGTLELECLLTRPFLLITLPIQTLNV